MKTLNAIQKTSFLMLALVCASCASTTPKSGKTITLFNGKNLTGWESVLPGTPAKAGQTWQVRDGAIHCSGEPMGYLRTRQTFTNYRFEAEYRWAPGTTPGNSGFFGRITGAPRALPRCIETQLKHGNAGDLYGFHGLKIAGDPARYKFIAGHEIGGDLSGVSRITGNEKPPGEWNQVTIQAQGPKIIVWFNGTLVNETTDAEVACGPVGLQSEGGQIQFRNLRITPLD